MCRRWRETALLVEHVFEKRFPGDCSDLISFRRRMRNALPVCFGRTQAQEECLFAFVVPDFYSRLKGTL